jgi:Phytanoyl-CoA dioxygenase (PhyH)
MITDHSMLSQKGWEIFPESVSASTIVRLNYDMQSAYDICRAVQIKNGLAENTDGTVHHLIGQGDSFIDVLEEIALWDTVQRYFGGNFILNSFGGVVNKPSGKTYTSNVHRDVRMFYKDYPLMLNMLIMLDDFTLENGATHLLSGSHLTPDKPEDDLFYKESERALGQAGSILLFNSNLWHSTGLNVTNKIRRALTLTFTRPFMKQQCDYPRVLGYEATDRLSPQLRQILGYNARVPASLEEWYQPPEKRMYQPGQG